ncbi:MAG TPA: DUF3618 domain-containing protein [Gaiellaceae bacterium]|jgi:ElaB/YqjD/DUF883 family membrane-anchored ribosome-binding protein|nr:DUF3618 domain-containing protein [Gaiellaceae bacterium]
MGKDPSDVREEIEETRSRMADTVDEIGNRADVKGRVKGYVAEKKEAVVGGAGDLASRAGDTLPDGETVSSGGRKVAGTARENPLAVAVGGAAVGFLVGSLLPSTRAEDEKMGTVADDLKERARETGSQALESGKQVASEVKESAMETAKESASEQSQELSSTLQDQAGSMTSGSSGEPYGGR